MATTVNTARRDTAFQAIICSDARVQTNWATPIPDGYFNLRIPDLQRDFYSFEQTIQEILDCGGEEIYKKILRGQIGALPLRFNATIDLLAPVVAYQFGVASAPSGGAAQVETAVVVGTITTAGNLAVTVTAAGMPNSPKIVNVAVLVADDASAVAGKIRTALTADPNVNGFCVVSGAGASVVLTKRAIAPTDASFNIAIANGTAAGLTPVVNSANTTASTPSVHNIGELPRGQYQPPVFSMILNFEGQPNALKLRGCVSNELNVEAAAGLTDSDLVANWTISFAEVLEIEGFSFPPCVNDLPLRFSDTVYIEEGKDWSATGYFQRARLSHSNAIVKGNSAFSGTGINPGRLQRASQRPRSMDTTILGDDRDILFKNALAIDNIDWSWQLGGPDRHVKFISASSEVSLEGGKLQKFGDINETAIARNATPTAPLSVVIKDEQTTSYLLPAV